MYGKHYKDVKIDRTSHIFKVAKYRIYIVDMLIYILDIYHANPANLLLYY